MNMVEVTSDASKLAQAGHFFGEWGNTVWNYEHTQLILLLILLGMVLYIGVGGWINAFGKSSYNFIYDLFEGTRMRWNRERELDALFADMIYNGTIKMEEEDKISAEEKKLYLSRIGNLVPIRDLLPKNDQRSLLEKLRDRLKRKPSNKKHPREQLAGLLRRPVATTAK